MNLWAVKRPELEEWYQGCIEATLEFALTLSSEDFKSLMGALRLYECCLGPEPFELVLEKNALKERMKVVVAQSKAKSAEAESSRLRKDLVEAMDQAVKSKEKADELKKALKYEKKHVTQKDDELQATLLQTAEAKDKGEAIDFSALDFETIDKKMIADESKEEERRDAKGVASVLADIEAKVEAKTIAAKTVVVAAGRGLYLRAILASRVCILDFRLELILVSGIRFDVD
nr:hypothetical protein CFP56_52987 [Quercus suber]